MLQIRQLTEFVHAGLSTLTHDLLTVDLLSLVILDDLIHILFERGGHNHVAFGVRFQFELLNDSIAIIEVRISRHRFLLLGLVTVDLPCRFTHPVLVHIGSHMPEFLTQIVINEQREITNMTGLAKEEHVLSHHLVALALFALVEPYRIEPRLRNGLEDLTLDQQAPEPGAACFFQPFVVFDVPINFPSTAREFGKEGMVRFT